MEKTHTNRDKWYQLDNAANIFPAVSNERNTNVFRLACELRENVDKVTLQQALEAAMKNYGHFRVVMRRGLFWFYLEQTDIEPKILFETTRPCGRIFYKHVKELLFTVSYYRRRINLEVFHSISDGSGAFGLLRAIVYHYLLLRYKREIPIPPPLDRMPPPTLGSEDSFAYHYDPDGKQTPIVERAYTIGGTMLPSNSIGIISGTVPTKQMLSLAKANGATATAYLTALLICAIYRGLMPKRALNRPIGVTIPVDLRGHFSSETSRNFFGVVDIRYSFAGKTFDFADVLQNVSAQLAEKIKPEALSKRMNYTMSAQKNIFARFTPLVLKNLVLGVVYRRSERATTTALSNLGRIVMPEEFTPYIYGFSCLLNPTPIHRVKLCISSFGDNFVMNFTSCIAETKAEKYFFRHLAENGVDVTITSNGACDDEVL